ncbi:hypothetical protein AX774_g1584 [Zancudomyces culisetae]|uniref:Uncharacterized protein n=1 Tax=Zancudomyces culisetae TaxID=1213189 RepID=A0A1R1PVB8_ZANCU|nr:hypothetical protein AX774_g1584 [Zancudomyces culisetae]|eukprot:OMH84891.1 hypothetical protein AX774_g1584 [Zancudomyces culisetae]
MPSRRISLCLMFATILDPLSDFSILIFINFGDYFQEFITLTIFKDVLIFSTSSSIYYLLNSNQKMLTLTAEKRKTEKVLLPLFYHSFKIRCPFVPVVAI